MVTEFAGQP